jgi:transcription termination factor Rho
MRKDQSVSDSTDLLDAPPVSGADGETSGASGAKPARRKATGLSGMVLAELQGLATELGISGTARMRKGQLIEAIKAPATDPSAEPGSDGATGSTASTDAGERPAAVRSGRTRAPRVRRDEATTGDLSTDAERADGAVRADRQGGTQDRPDRSQQERPDRQQRERSQPDDRTQQDRQDRQQADRTQQDRQDRQPDDDDFEGRGGRSRRRGRYRDR